MTSRCSCIATTTNKICRHKYSYLLVGKRYCTLHARIKFNTIAACIQSAWRAHNVRNKMKNIFLRLDDDMQRKIIWHMREAYLLEKHHHSIIRNILKNKVTTLYNNNAATFGGGSWIPNLQYYNQDKYYKTITSIYNLYYKYHVIVDNDDCRVLLNLKRNFIVACSDSVRNNNLRNAEGGIIPKNEATVTYNQLYNSIKQWEHLYSNK